MSSAESTKIETRVQETAKVTWHQLSPNISPPLLSLPRQRLDISPSPSLHKAATAYYPTLIPILRHWLHPHPQLMRTNWVSRWSPVSNLLFRSTILNFLPFDGWTFLIGFGMKCLYMRHMTSMLMSWNKESRRQLVSQNISLELELYFCNDFLLKIRSPIPWLHWLHTDGPTEVWACANQQRIFLLGVRISTYMRSLNITKTSRTELVILIPLYIFEETVRCFLELWKDIEESVIP